MSGDAIAALVGVAAALVLAGRSLRSRRLPLGKTAAMAAIWLVIIAGTAFAISQFSGR